MLNDKFIIEASCNYVYRIAELKNTASALNAHIIKHYPNLKLIDVQEGFADSNLIAITFQDTNSLDVAIIYQGSTNLHDWRNDNLNNFLNKNIQQYEAAQAYFKHLEKKYRITHVGGNSLGGGCAQYVGINQPHVRAIGINSSPLSNTSKIDTKNIYNIRVSSDPLYRCVSLDKQRYEDGYAGNIIFIKRSLYGNYDYFNTIELAHRGAVIFPYEYIHNKYKVNNMMELKNAVDKKVYQAFVQLKRAPSLAQFMSFDLITNNIDKNDKLNLSELQSNFNYRIKELNSSFLEYSIINLESKVGNPLIHVNDEISESLKSIIKYSLLHITKQEEKLYDNIYFIIEKSTNYFYKLIVKSLHEIDLEVDSEHATKDYNKIIYDINTNKTALNQIINYLIEINNELVRYDKFSLKNILPSSKIKEFDFTAQKFSLDYKTIIYDKIDDTVDINIARNRLFIEQLERIIGVALTAKKVSLQITQYFGKNDLDPKDIDYIMKKYDLASVIEEALEIFKEDIHEIILAQSLLFIYQNNIRNINEQLLQLQLTINNLRDYILTSKDSLRKKRLLKRIEIVDEYTKRLIKFNNDSLV